MGGSMSEHCKKYMGLLFLSSYFFFIGCFGAIGYFRKGVFRTMYKVLSSGYLGDGMRGIDVRFGM